MNGIRGKTSSPPIQSGQPQQRNIGFTFVGSAEDYHQQLYQQNQPQQYPQLGGPSQSYDITKTFGAPRMPSPGVGQQQQQPTSMYQQQPQQQGMRGSNAPFYPNQQNVRQRFPNMQSQPNPQTGMYMPQMIYQMNPQGQFGQQPIVISPGMVGQIPSQRMPTPPYNQGMPSTQPGIYQIPPQSINSYPQQQQGYGNAPMYYGQNASQPQRPTSAPSQASQPPKQQRKHILKIVDPISGKDVTGEILHTGEHAAPPTSSSGSRSTPVSTETALAQSPPNEIAAEFAAKVAASLSSNQANASINANIHQQRPPSNPSSQQVQQMGHPTHAGVMPPMNMPADGQTIKMGAPGAMPMCPHTGPPPLHAQSTPVNIPVNTNMHQGHIDMMVPPPPVPHNSVDPTHNVNSICPPEPIKEQPPVVVTPSLSNGSTSQQRPQVQIARKQNENVEVKSNVKLPSSVVVSSDSTSSKPSSVVSVKPADTTKQGGQPQERSEPVKVGVDKNSERTNAVSDVKENKCDSAKTVNSSREATPEVNIMPPTPVEKDVKIELQAETKEPEPAVEAFVPKKEKAKKKGKEINKKGEQIGSEFDAYTDTTVVVPEETAPTETEPVVSEEKVEQVVNKQQLSVDRDPSPPATTPTPPTTRETTPADETIQKVEIKIQDAEEQKVQGDEELEEGEIRDDESDKMMELRYKYSEDQWSPLNPEGKKHYDRDFLIQFQFEAAAISKPDGLPDIPDIILDKPNMGRQYSSQMSTNSNESQDSGFDFTPKYVWSSSGQSGPRQSRGLPRQPSNQKNKGPGGGGPPRQINLSISKDIELHHAKEAWKPGHKDVKEKIEDDVEDSKSEELYKKTRSILNKLTPQMFQKLVSQMQALPIDTENRLKGVIDLVFEKAISEPNFSVAYANMCRCLSMFKVASVTKPGEMVNFRAILLTRCQREFEKDKSSEALFIAKRKEIEKAEESKKEELKQELQYEESKAKRRSLGNIRFIGELFKLKMLTENIMHDCVFKLLRTKDPENLECLCRLLTTIGKELDSDKAKPRMDQYFNQMGKIVNDKKTSARVRFMLQDVMDVRTNKWVPRRTDNNPKTIDQIHKEVQQEAQEKALMSQQVQQQQKDNRGRGGGGGGRRGPPGAPMGGGADGWNTVGSRTPLKSVDRSIDPSKMKFSKQNVDDSIQLGPGGGASRFAGWGRGSTGGTTGRPSQEKEKTAPNTPANRFSALSKPDEDSSRRYGGVSPARADPRGRGFGRPPSLNTRQSQESEKEKAISAAKAIGMSRSMEGRGRDMGRSREEKPAAPAAPAVKELSLDEMEKKTKAIIDEYLHIQDIKEALTCVKEFSPLNHHQLVYNSINHVLERSSVARKQTGHLLNDFVKDKVISVDSYLKGLLEVLEFAEDMEIDIPKIWQYYGELISPMIQDGSVPLSFLKQVCQPLVSSNKAGILLAEVLHDASQREGHKKIGGLWLASGLQWSEFVPKNQVDQFLIDKKLEFTKGGDSVPTTPTTGLPLPEIAEKLHELIVIKKADNESVFDWIETNVDEPTTKRPKFIRALMTAVCNSAIQGERGKVRVEPKELKTRHDLLQKYLDHQPDSELQGLYALQALVTKLEHPPGVLRTMFDSLYDEDIISEDAFIQWEKSEDEPEGKGAALKQVVQFFTWLKEAEEDS